MNASFSIKHLCVGLLLLASGYIRAAEEMTPARFREIVSMPGDSKALRKELSSLTIWKNSVCSMTMNFQDGREFKEECAQTTRTIGGDYVVFSLDSKFYKQTIHSIVGYDSASSTIRCWGLYGDVLTQATIVLDPEKKTSASISRYDGFEEITVCKISDTEMSEYTKALKDGVLFMTRTAKTRPVAGAGEKPASPEGSSPSAAPKQD